MSDPSDPKKLDARTVILARRARFLAAAMTSISIACGKDQPPQPCLSPIAVPADAAASPNALAPEGATDASRPPEAATDGGGDSSTADGGAGPDAGAPVVVTKPKPDAGRHSPQVCLRVAPPQPCLKVRVRDPNDPM